MDFFFFQTYSTEAKSYYNCQHVTLSALNKHLKYYSVASKYG